MKQLRQYVRQVLLTEGAKGIEDLPDNVRVRINSDSDLCDIGFEFYSEAHGKYLSTKRQMSKLRLPDGEIQMYRANPEYGNCSGAWMVSLSVAYDNWGPFLYDIAMEYATMNGGGLISDRESVSPDALNVWDYYMKNRSDVDHDQLDDEADSFRNGPADDCEQEEARYTASTYGGWQKSPLSKVYKKPPTLINQLRKAGKIKE